MRVGVCHITLRGQDEEDVVRRWRTREKAGWHEDRGLKAATK